MKKSNSVITHVLDVVLGRKVIRFNVGEQSFEMPVEGLSDDVAHNALVHGLVQKISDRAAIGRDPETGASASPEDKFTAMKECADRLMVGGPWNAVATGGPGNVGGLLYRAMRTLYPNAWADKTTFAAYIVQKAISESARLGKHVSEGDVRTGLMGVKKIAAEIARIRASEAKASPVDAGAMLQELE